MMSKVAGCVAVLLVSSSVWAQSTPNPCLAKPKTEETKSGDKKEYDLACATYTGEVVRGPRTIVAKNLNVLRYDYRWNSSVSFQAAPDVWSKLTGLNTTSTTAPPTTPTAAKGLAGGAEVPPELQGPLQKLLDLIAETEKQIKPVDDHKSEVQTNLADLQTQQTIANTATTQVAGGGASLKSFLSSASGTPAQIVSGMADQLADVDSQVAPKPNQDSVFIAGIKAKWADATTVSRIRDSSRILGTQLDDLKTAFATFIPRQSAALEGAKTDLAQATAKLQQGKKKLSDEQQKRIDSAIKSATEEQDNLSHASSLLNWAVTANNQVITAIPDLDTGGTKYAAFRAAQDLLTTWKRRMESLQGLWTAYSKDTKTQPNPFDSQIEANCEFAFSRTKQTTITLSQTDLMPGSTATSAATVLSVIVECTSPFTISAGVAFSTIGQKEFAIQPVATPPGSTTTTNEFVATNKSSFHPLPIAMVHARVWEPTETIALHVSFGLAGNFQSQNSGGSTAEFLIGPSLSLFRTMFITPGLHIGRKAELGSGFTVGQPAPANVTSPPLQTSYTTGFGVAITFTKP